MSKITKRQRRIVLVVALALLLAASDSTDSHDVQPEFPHEQAPSGPVSTVSCLVGLFLRCDGGAVGCYGDGTTGRRVHAIYAHASDVTSRYAEIAPMIGGWAGVVEGVFVDSAAETGGVRHVRWVTASRCRLVVADVALSAAGDDSFSNLVAELRARGFDRTDRKYLVWLDAQTFCGLSQIRGDDQPGSGNANNGGPSVSAIGRGCWGAINSTEAHELMHALGAVQSSAPNSTGRAHCTDEFDRMCYRDSSGAAMRYVCATSHERLFDCGHDDYFSTNPPAGSYLATHWNAASSGFLATRPPDALSTGVTR